MQANIMDDTNKASKEQCFKVESYFAQRDFFDLKGK